MNAEHFKHLLFLEIKIGESGVWYKDEQLSSAEEANTLVREAVWLATWFVYDDKKCSAGHLHKQYKTMKHTDLNELMKMLPKEKDNG